MWQAAIMTKSSDGNGFKAQLQFDGKPLVKTVKNELDIPDHLKETMEQGDHVAGLIFYDQSLRYVYYVGENELNRKMKLA